MLSLCSVRSWAAHHITHPANTRRTLNKLPTELRRRSFVNKHRLSTQNRCPNVQKLRMRHVHVPAELPSSMPNIGVFGYVLSKVKKNSNTLPPPPPLQCCAHVWLGRKPSTVLITHRRWWWWLGEGESLNKKRDKFGCHQF